MGPCLCGDPSCPSCGSPGAAALEAAEEWASEQLYAAKLSPDEYRLAVRAGLFAVKLAREAVRQHREQQALLAAEEQHYALTRSNEGA